MNSDRWDRIRTLFDAAESLPVAERIALLEAECGNDTLLKDEVLNLLRADTDAGETLESIVGHAAVGLEEQDDDERIGPYRIIRETGHGGMGRVFLAERDDGEFDQVVALKVVRSGIAADLLAERFRRERQILARLQHPNIARLLDGGVTEDGRPYFALEYVEGVPIDEYCDRKRLSIDERLTLFQDVCQAVVYAHANLVVHRDLKPDNILATESGQVRLLDFGIAKVLVDDDAPAVPGTVLVAMTPAYASPEQVRGEPVGTGTDVYSLGVILYELLTGLRPYDLDSQRPTEVERVVCETEPVRPSTRVSKETAGPAADHGIVSARVTDRSRLRRKLSGDLDVICMKALRKEPHLRYGSVEALSDDITRHLEGRPVLARPTTLGYRLGKGMRRHRWAVGAAAAIVVSSSTLVAFYTARLADERDRAQLEAAKAGEVADFLQSLFEIADPEESLGETVTARELLDRGAARIDEGLVGQPEVQANMLLVIGNVYRSLGLFDDGHGLLERAVALNLELHGDTHPDVALSLISLAQSFQDRGDFASAGPAFDAALDAYRRAFPAESPEVSEAVEHYGYWLETDGKYEEAEAQYRLTLSHLRAQLPEDDPQIASAIGRLGTLLRQHGDPAEAEPLLREALAMERELLGPLHPDVASSMRTLASLLRDEGQYEESQALYEEVLAIRRRVLGPDHTEVGNALNSYAILLSRMGEDDRAIKAFQESLAINEAGKGAHPDVAAGYHNVGAELREHGRLDEAVEHFLRSIELQEVIFRDGHPNKAFPRVGLAGAYLDMGEPSRAEPWIREALAIRTAALPENHRYVGEAYSELGATLMALDRGAEAESALLHAHDILMEAEGADASRTRRVRRRLVRLYEARGETAKAAPFRPDGA